MPHVVIEGPIDLARVHRDLTAFEERHGTTVLKVRDSFLARSGRTLLLDAVVVEGPSRRFLIELDEHKGSLTVRLFPPTDPEKTAGVKRLLAAVATRLLRLEPGARVVRTNLAAELAEAGGAAGATATVATAVEGVPGARS